MLYAISGLTVLLSCICSASFIQSSAFTDDGWSSWSDWSDCSRSCNGGVRTQTRVCQQHRCTGAGVRTAVCNIQVCDDAIDPWEDLCVQHGSSSSSRGDFGPGTRWVPQTDPGSPCSLTCRDLRSGRFSQLSAGVPDGTPCSVGIRLGFCVSGQCQTVGCDLTVGSSVTLDICGVCGGNGASCGTGRHYWVQRFISHCSVDCGGGVRVSRPVCHDTRMGQVVSDDLCDLMLRPRDKLIQCAVIPCPYRWVSGSWGNCSVVCGGGIRHRRVWCTQNVNATESQVSEVGCLSTERPPATDVCNSVSCPVWYLGVWSQCSAECGETGSQTRSVFCRDLAGSPSDLCDPDQKPSSRRPCADLTPCPLSQVKQPRHQPDNAEMQPPLALPATLDISGFHGNDSQQTSREPGYVTGSWSVCSVSCGVGVRTRSVQCQVYLQFSGAITTLPDRICGTPRPPSQQRCVRPPCQPARRSSLAESTNADESELDVTRRHALPASPSSSSTVSNSVLNPGYRSTAIRPPAEHHDPSRSGQPRRYAGGHGGGGGAGRGESEWSGVRFGRVHEGPPGGHVTLVRQDRGPPLTRLQPPRVEGIRILHQQMLDAGRQYEDVDDSLHRLGLHLRRNGVEGVEKLSAPASSSMADVMKQPEEVVYAWKKAGFTTCTAACLGGVQELILVCVDSESGEEVSPFLCPLDSRPQLITRTCNDMPCPPQWNVTAYSSCSRSCGKGVEVREVRCMHALARGEGNTLHVEDSECSSPRPSDSRICNAVNCTPQWQPGSWSQCSRECGGGVKHRWLKCQQRLADGSVLDKAPSLCGVDKPSDVKPCNMAVCQAPTITTSNQTFHQEIIQRRVVLSVGGSASVYKGTTVRIKCPVKRFDRSMVVWSRDGVRISSTDKYKLYSSGQLAIKFIEFHDAAKYTCIAGSATASLQLSVRMSPIGELPWVREHRLKEKRRQQLRQQRRLEEEQRRTATALKIAESEQTADRIPDLWNRSSDNQQSNTINTEFDRSDQSDAEIQSNISADIRRDKEAESRDLSLTHRDPVTSSGSRPQPLLHALVSSIKRIILGSGRDRTRNRWKQRLTPATTSSTTSIITSSTTSTTASLTSTSAVDLSTFPQQETTAGVTRTSSASPLEKTTTGLTFDMTVDVDQQTVNFTTTIAASTSPPSSSTVRTSTARTSTVRTSTARASTTRASTTRTSTTRASTARTSTARTSTAVLPTDIAGLTNGTRYVWLLSAWSVCSRRCGGGGLQVRAVQCLQNTADLTRAVSSRRCQSVGLTRPTALRPCASEPCASWQHRAWQPCSRGKCISWNTAIQRRQVSCRLDNGTRVSSGRCERHLRPGGRRECYNDRCRGQWHVGTWSECSTRATCDAAGYQSRVLRCVWHGTRHAAGNTCRDLPRPSVIKPCLANPCQSDETSAVDAVPELSHSSRYSAAECRDVASYCDRVEKLSLCKLDRIQSDCCQTCRDKG